MLYNEVNTVLSAIFDSHTHSDNSHDGHHPISFMGETAESKGMAGFCVTDHFECNMPEEKHTIRLRDSFYESAMAREAFGGRLLITSGIELGQATQNLPLAEKILKQYDFDFVLGSLHNLQGQRDLCHYQFEGMDVQKIILEYYAQMLELCQWGKFDVLAHMTYPLRYIMGIQKIPVDLTPVDEVIGEILTVLVKKDKGLEINTSTLCQGLGETMPGLRYVKLFRELGGKYITLGSDAHYAEHIGSNFSDGLALAKEAGFDHFAVYRKREPQLHKIG